MGVRVLWRPADALDRFPAEGGPAIAGVAVELRVESCVEPTAAARAEYAAALERASRTIHLSGPADVFGPRVPARESRFTVNLDDPRLTASDVPDGVSGTVSGRVLQVGRQVPCSVYTAIASVAADTRADAVDGELFVRLLVDPPSR